MNIIRALKNIPLHLNRERSQQLIHGQENSHRLIYLRDTISFLCPDNAFVINLWQFHSFSRKGYHELLEFTKLAKNCTNFLDIGASGGIFSALFSATSPKGHIVSVEPDTFSYQILLETANANNERRNAFTNSQSSWVTVNSAISDKDGPVGFQSSGYGGEISHSSTNKSIIAEKIETLCTRLNFIPDLIKIDIESFEFEALTSSKEWLQQHRPRLFVEIHWNLLKQRGIDPAAFLDELQDWGLCINGSKKRLSQWVPRHLNSAGCLDIPLQWR